MINLSGLNTSIRVTPEILKSRASDADQKIREMDRLLHDIQKKINGTGNYWIGEAGEACRKCYESRQNEVDEIMKRLKNQPKTLLTIANVYAEEEQQAVNESAPLPSNVID